ncbi:MAG TPA: oxygen-independent coproporphyrinogen III oxidase [Firmicutes bacterium]|nr:oxygen-independent coproporphyrinogen III oxidase [Bacillota bacterium]HBM69941.1 oxygen-independent coproporphyrinogen III oxidase [Bacillota bacterium]HBX24796.1 oxygen-independent coproporphyrinogen III oxidase [Bacillota bacterium]
MKPSSLYVHIPFCNHICPYCDFPKVVYEKQWAFSYLNSLLSELDSLSLDKLDTIYIGGGTPTSLDISLLDKLLKKLSSYLNEGGEFSIEANPDSLDEEKIKVFSKNKINRVSLGVQSTIKSNLDFLGRKHNYEDVKKCVELLRKHCINNINCDLIYAYNGLSIKDLNKTIEDILALNVPHVSAYSLILEKGTLFYNKGIKEENEDIAASQYEFILNKLRNCGYKRYEVSNFAKNGFECKHNLVYWKDEEYYAIGLGASSYVKGIRSKNTLNLSSYLKNEFKGSYEVVGKEDDIKYFLLTNLRLEDGFPLEKFEQRFSSFDKDILLKKAKKMIDASLLRIKNDRLMATDKGLLLLDYILINLF